MARCQRDLKLPMTHYCDAYGELDHYLRKFAERNWAWCCSLAARTGRLNTSSGSWVATRRRPPQGHPVLDADPLRRRPRPAVRLYCELWSTGLAWYPRRPG